MKKFVWMLVFCLTAGSVQAMSVEWINRIDNLKKSVNYCATTYRDMEPMSNSNEAKRQQQFKIHEKFAQCMVKALVPVYDGYAMLSDNNLEEAKKVAKELAYVSWDNTWSALPYNMNTSLPLFLMYETNIDSMNRIIYGKNYPVEAGQKAALAKPFQHWRQHMVCAKDPHKYECSRGTEKAFPAIRPLVEKRIAKKLTK